MTASQTVRLLDAVPDIAMFLDEEQRAAAEAVVVPVRTVSRGPLDLDALRAQGVFAAVVLDGMLVAQLGVADHVALRLLGPGDVVSVGSEPRSMLVVESQRRA